MCCMQVCRLHLLIPSALEEGGLQDPFSMHKRSHERHSWCTCHPCENPRGGQPGFESLHACNLCRCGCVFSLSPHPLSSFLPDQTGRHITEQEHFLLVTASRHLPSPHRHLKTSCVCACIMYVLLFALAAPPSPHHLHHAHHNLYVDCHLHTRTMPQTVV